MNNSKKPKKKLTISILMPALNEEKNIAKAIENTLQALNDYELDGEIICINDGSSDETLNIINNYKLIDGRISCINHAVKCGFGASFWTGISSAKNEIVVLMPGDNENNPWEIFRYIDLLDSVDIVIPFVYNKKVRSKFRIVLSYIYRLIINISFNTNLNYTNGTVLYRSEILKDIDYQSKGFFFQTDLLIRLIQKGYLFAEVPYRLEQNNEHVTKAISFPSLVDVIFGYFLLLKEQYFVKKNNPIVNTNSISYTRYINKNSKMKV